MSKKSKNSYNNSIIKTLLAGEYHSSKIIKSIAIFKRTKSTRIKNKHFNNILFLALEEKKIIKCEDVVLMTIEEYKKISELTRI